MEGEDSHVSEVAGVPGFEYLAKDQNDVMTRYFLGGGAKVSPHWEPLGPIDFLGTFGPELSLGATLRKQLDPKDGIAIVKFTHSGAQGPDWFPQGSPEAHRNLYPRFLAFIREAQADLKRRGFECSLEAIFWHSGENDTYFTPYAQNTSPWLKQLIQQVRTDLDQPALPWFISAQPKQAPWPNVERVNTALSDLAQSVPHVSIIPTSDLPHTRNFFGTRGTLLLGQEMARAYLNKP